MFMENGIFFPPKGWSLNHPYLGETELFAIPSAQPGGIFHVLAVARPAGLAPRRETPSHSSVLKMANISTTSHLKKKMSFGSGRVYAQKEGTLWRWLEQKAAYQRDILVRK